METLDGSRRLIREWETIGMEEDDSCCCCCEREAGLHRQNTLIQLLRQKESRLQRMARFLAVALLLLVLAALALLVTVVLKGRGHQSPDSQPMKQPDSHSSGVSVKQQQFMDFKNPSAMLTAPDGSNIDGEYLQWESKKGNAHCHGGFNYSGGNLVVPRNGIYRVFLQITYESKLGPKCDRDVRLTINVFRIADSYNDNVLILSSFDTVSCSMEHWRKTLYTAGSFSLEANSRLRVKSAHSEHIVNQEDLVFFGAELLPQ
ncbi:tumor necrosis factor ligand superfamily member 15-like [Xiphias gladius]|uniref:tumor necrosis factor ligand superfamily member 15-like n=1 Tax=Xiphias gladius TaxID=8245 RepID=UPI001A9889FE|nr:tumor necrosis factor ligand superfamily member 15-like [Xiphias gladius]